MPTFAPMRPLPALILCALLLCALTLPVRAATLYVSPNGSDDNSGAIASPYKTIQAAVNNASSGDTIALAYAIYQGNGNRDIDFAGKSLSVVSQSGPGKAIIDCQGTEQEGHYAFNFHSKEINILFDGLTIKNGNSQAAVRVGQGCTIKLNKCGFRDNTGECISNNGTATLTGCLFLSNPGHGIDTRGTATLTGCTFTSNSSAGVSNEGTMVLTGCTFTSNSGGGVSNGGRATLTDCTFTSNSCSGLGGGGVLNRSTATLIGCRFINNTSNADTLYGGGGILNYILATVTLSGCTFTGNISLRRGGGVFNVSTATLTNCIISGNTAIDNGGGIYNGGNASIRFCNISANIAKTAVNQQSPAQGGALENDGTAVLTNDILWGNTASYASGIGTPTNGGQTTTVTYCDIQGGLSGTGNIKANPLFVSTANPIMPPIAVANVGDADLHLQAGSPAGAQASPFPLPKPTRANTTPNLIPVSLPTPMSRSAPTRPAWARMSIRPIRRSRRRCSSWT